MIPPARSSTLLILHQDGSQLFWSNHRSRRKAQEELGGDGRSSQNLLHVVAIVFDHALLKTLERSKAHNIIEL